MKWEEEHDIFLCRMRLTHVTVQEVAEAASKKFGTRITKASAQGRLHKRGVRISKSSAWFEKCKLVFSRVLVDEISFEKACEIIEESSNWDSRWSDSMRVRMKSIYNQLFWQQNHLTDVPKNKHEWPAYRANLMGLPLPIVCSHCGQSIPIVGTDCAD